MHIIPFKGKNASGDYNLNLLYNQEKTYVMDNHLAASWCWMKKLCPTKKYNLFHIDRHYDLLNNFTNLWIKELNKQSFDFTRSSITELLAIKYNSPNFPERKIQVFRYDNYLTILNSIYPNLIDATFFSTHKDGSKINSLEIQEYEIYELLDNFSDCINENNQVKWVVNIDIDYFFTKKNEKYFQFLTDEYIHSVADEIKKAWDNIDVLTIALSPGYCGGWDNSLRVARIITDYLQLDFDIQ